MTVLARIRQTPKIGLVILAYVAFVALGRAVFLALSELHRWSMIARKVEEENG